MALRYHLRDATLIFWPGALVCAGMLNIMNHKSIELHVLLVTFPVEMLRLSSFHFAAALQRCIGLENAVAAGASATREL